MEAITWVPGTDQEFDQLFNVLRIQQYNDKSHRLWKNYGPDAFENATALTITFNDENQPEICSSIITRPCWPNNVYRILNRTWKQVNRLTRIPGLSPAFGATTLHQIEWLKENTEHEMFFISRGSEMWANWMVNKFKIQYNLEFKTDHYKYLTCPNECDDTCWQTMIYIGNSELLSQWKRRP
jgi:hypothetical protein